MNSKELAKYMEKNGKLLPDTPEMEAMQKKAQKVRLLCQELNAGVYDDVEIREKLSNILEYKVPDSLCVVLPVNVDCGMNLQFGENVFVNSGCQFQDQGGIYIGDNTLIGHQVVFATLNHGEAVKDRGVLEGKPIRVGANVWIGAHATILGGVTIGEGAIVAAGSVVTRDVLEHSIVAGTPAKMVRMVKE